jgi:hypothetical protein
LAADQASIGAMLGFLTRDLAIVVLASTFAKRRGSDFAAIAILFVLYALLPAIAGGMQIEGAALLFFPRTGDPVWLSPAIAWSEAVLAAVFAVGRLALPQSEAKGHMAQA